MDAGASGQAVRCANCGSSNVTNRTEHVVLISAQIGRTLGRSVALRGVYNDGPRLDCALPHFVCARRFTQRFPVFANQRRVTRG